MSGIITESEIEEHALQLLQNAGYDYIHGPDISPEGDCAERTTYSDMILKDRVRDAISRINPDIPRNAREESIEKLSFHPHRI
ncbi:type I restriction endonuclease [Methanohalophilus profundi]|uniref:type I restriction endonuclease n=1 Tax=Methanohalophilus profundi TaxID=2138083 RepID=UPI00101D9A8A|nr:type I restriction endonuclease [Methanohalophilus profundi]